MFKSPVQSTLTVERSTRVGARKEATHNETHNTISQSTGNLTKTLTTSKQTGRTRKCFRHDRTQVQSLQKHRIF